MHAIIGVFDPSHREYVESSLKVANLWVSFWFMFETASELSQLTLRVLLLYKYFSVYPSITSID